MSTSHARHGHAEVDGPSAKEVLGYLHELLRQSAFNASERNRRFLTYVVEETLQGRADRIKAYNIALAAFDRTADFDPLTDPIVRIEASRLRRSLEHYYLTAGNADRIRISIPKGSYAAMFSYQGRTPEEMPANDAAAANERLPVRPQRPARWPRTTWAKAAVAAVCSLAVVAIAFFVAPAPRERPTQNAAAATPSILILPLEDTGGDRAHAFVARGLTHDIRQALMELPNLAVYAPVPGPSGSAGADPTASDFTLMGSVQADRDSMRVALFLMDTRTGRFLGTWRFRRSLAGKSLVAIQAEIAQEIRASLAHPCQPFIPTTADKGELQAENACQQPVVLSKK